MRNKGFLNAVARSMPWSMLIAMCVVCEREIEDAFRRSKGDLRSFYAYQLFTNLDPPRADVRLMRVRRAARFFCLQQNAATRSTTILTCGWDRCRHSPLRRTIITSARLRNTVLQNLQHVNMWTRKHVRRALILHNCSGGVRVVR